MYFDKLQFMKYFFSLKPIYWPVKYFISLLPYNLFVSETAQFLAAQKHSLQLIRALYHWLSAR